MTDRSLYSMFAMVAVAGIALIPNVVLAQNPDTETRAASRTPWGAPDLNGVWDFRTLTPFERPGDLGDQAFFTDEEAAQFEAAKLAELDVRDDQEPADIVGNYNQLWFEPGDKVSGTNQTSLVVDPLSGQVPPVDGRRRGDTDDQTISARRGESPLADVRRIRRRPRPWDVRGPMHPRL